MTVNELIASLEVLKKTCECDVGELELSIRNSEDFRVHTLVINTCSLPKDNTMPSRYGAISHITLF